MRSAWSDSEDTSDHKSGGQLDYGGIFIRDDEGDTCCVVVYLVKVYMDNYGAVTVVRYVSSTVLWLALIPSGPSLRTTSILRFLRHRHIRCLV